MNITTNLGLTQYPIDREIFFILQIESMLMALTQLKPQLKQVLRGTFKLSVTVNLTQLDTIQMILCIYLVFFSNELLET
ncbi:hypothetical protein OOA_11013 [Providencia burhodogranariea DSM 19968]|uniref:Uncharacterized protein n=1 Tax=Providencia burhodogranariea DSM 19968 TaxID=1141662 RepID=K8WKE3_9GAMM|nr:hypothetical protein OOA_11013 [Providencia burhodogranariea DSM 19968]